MGLGVLIIGDQAPFTFFVGRVRVRAKVWGSGRGHGITVRDRGRLMVTVTRMVTVMRTVTDMVYRHGYAYA